MKYKTGDKVRVRNDLICSKHYYMDNKEFSDTAVPEMCELRGQIVTIETVGEKYRIKEDRKTKWNWTDEMFEPINNRKIVITSDGKDTIARLYEDNWLTTTATAKCSPDDTFVFETGARIALDRLLGYNVKAENPKYYNGKVVCVKKTYPHMAYTIGKVYEFKDGRVKIDNGNLFPVENNPVKSLDEWNNRDDVYAKFIPLVE